jgi:hypothetical protein
MSAGQANSGHEFMPWCRQQKKKSQNIPTLNNRTPKYSQACHENDFFRAFQKIVLPHDIFSLLICINILYDVTKQGN